MRQRNNDALAIFLAITVAVFGIGVSVGERHHPGKVLVPRDSGGPSDLPLWACSEIVTRRMRELDVLEGRTPLPVMHYSEVGCEGSPR